jgi:hypothetical protein
MLTSVNIRKHAKDVSRASRVRGAPAPLPNANIRETPLIGFPWLRLAFAPAQPWLFAEPMLAFVGFGVGFPWLSRESNPPAQPHAETARLGGAQHRRPQPRVSETEIDHVQTAALAAQDERAVRLAPIRAMGGNIVQNKNIIKGRPLAYRLCRH